MDISTVETIATLNQTIVELHNKIEWFKTALDAAMTQPTFPRIPDKRRAFYNQHKKDPEVALAAQTMREEHPDMPRWKCVRKITDEMFREAKH